MNVLEEIKETAKNLCIIVGGVGAAAALSAVVALPMTAGMMATAHEENHRRYEAAIRKHTGEQDIGRVVLTGGSTGRIQVRTGLGSYVLCREPDPSAAGLYNDSPETTIYTIGCVRRIG